MKSILIDTNAMTALFRGADAVLEAAAEADCVYASAIVIGELEAGFRGGDRYAQNVRMLNRFVTRPTVEILPVGRETADCFGRIKQALKKKGSPIPVNDIWVSAQCLETGSVLVTYDRHYVCVDGLRLWTGLPGA
jgi:tRNA(fMet)-specific endonuclease VapC